MCWGERSAISESTSSSTKSPAAAWCPREAVPLFAPWALEQQKITHRAQLCLWARAVFLACYSSISSGFSADLQMPAVLQQVKDPLILPK